jgi:hypothetical protein
MDYQEFRAEFDPVYAVLDEPELPVWLPAAVARLKELAAAIEDPSDRRSAAKRIAALEGVLDAESDGPPISPAMMEAIRVYSAAGAAAGTPAERIARAEVGMATIGRIAEANPAEEASIMELNKSLYTLMLSLEPDSR